MPTIRPARPVEAVELTALCLRSKAHWGYDAAFMRQSRAALTVTEAMISSGRVLVAETAAGRLAGVAAVARLDECGRFVLSLMFVDPAAIRAGIGRALFKVAVRLAASAGGTSLTILADPFAEAFYRRLGAVRIGEAPSDAIPGRMVPLLEYTINESRS